MRNPTAADEQCERGAMTRIARESLHFLPRERLSRALGRFALLGHPRSALRCAIDLYVRTYGVDLTEALIPPKGFQSFDEFFTRRLRPEVRPIEPDAGAILCPADGVIQAFGGVSENRTIHVKGTEYELPELLGCGAAELDYRGGAYWVVYLSPRDYHRVHAPVSGDVRWVRHTPGGLYPVNSIGLRFVPRLFCRSQRVSVLQESAVYGRVTTVLVGAVGVGRIGLSFDEGFEINSSSPSLVKHYRDTERPLARGEELGIFHLGSTVVLLVQAGKYRHVLRDAGEKVRMGQALARATDIVNSQIQAGAP